MTNGRRTAAVLAVALLATTAGCGFLLGDEALTFEAAQATVSEQARSDTGYEQVGTDAQTATMNFSAAGQTRRVEVRNRLAQYDRRVDLPVFGEQRLATAIVFASPEVEVLGRTFNPLEKMSNRDILSEMGATYDGFRVGSQVSSRQATVLGEGTTVEKYEGSAKLDGENVDVYVHVTKVKHEGDFVVAMAVYPQRLDGEGDRVITLFEGVEHSGDGQG